MSQKSKMLNYLVNGRTLSTKQARTLFRAQKPSARIRELRQDGNVILSTRNKVGNFAYLLVQPA